MVLIGSLNTMCWLSLLQVPYMQIRENNWTFNTNLKGKWNVRYDL